MITEPKIEYRSKQHYIAVRTQVPVPFGPLLPALYQEGVAWLVSRGVSPAGAPIIRYLTTDMSTKLDIEVGWPVAAAVAGDDRIIAGVIPAGRYAVLTYTGPYEGLVEATAALLDWAEKNNIVWKKSTINGVEWWEARLEHYMTDPNEEPDPHQWQTELAFLIANDSIVY
jgi:effector-binding domain-containing protein